MTRQELEPFLCQHGKITGTIQSGRKQMWGMITEIEENYLNFVDHYNHFHIFANKDVKSFKSEAINMTTTYPLFKCDCGHRYDERFTCAVCGTTFCGLCGSQEWIGNKNKDVCNACLKTIKTGLDG